MLYAVAVFAPLFGSVIALLLGRQIGDKASQAVTVLCMILAAICGAISFIPVLEGHATPGVVSLGTWIDVEGFHASGRCVTTRSPRSWWRWSPLCDADPYLQHRLHEP